MDGMDGRSRPPAELERRQALIWCGAAYALAIADAVGVGFALRGAHPLVIVAGADAAGTIVIFAFSRAFNNSSFYDPYWSVAPMAIVVYWTVWGGSAGASAVREAAVFVLVWAWGARLTFNFLRGWAGLRHEDWRYVNLRKQNGRWYWVVSFFGVHFAPTAWVYLGCLALYPAYTSPRAFGVVDALAVIVTAGAIALEAIADRQLWQFRRTSTEPGAIMKAGLWRYSRHPNYLGEIGFWWGLFLIALAADASMWWTIAGPVSITLLFVFISVPMIDKRHVARRPGYAEHMKATPGLLPWLRRAGSRGA